VKDAAAAMGRGRKRREKERKEVGRAVEKYFAERQGSAAVERLEHFQRVFRGTKEIASMVRKKWMLIDRVGEGYFRIEKIMTDDIISRSLEKGSS